MHGLYHTLLARGIMFHSAILFCEKYVPFQSGGWAFIRDYSGATWAKAMVGRIYLVFSVFYFAPIFSITKWSISINFFP